MEEAPPSRSVLAERASLTLRNHLSSLIVLSDVLSGGGSRSEEAVAALRTTVVELALDADLLADLATTAAETPIGAASLTALLRESVRPLSWLGDLVGTPLSVQCSLAESDSFLEPRDVVVPGRRLVAALITVSARGRLVLELCPYGDGAMLAARRADCPLEHAHLVDAPAPTSASDAHLAVAAWALERTGLRVRILVDRGKVIAALLRPA